MASRLSDSIIELKNVSVSYGEVQALKEVNLSIYPSNVNAVVGEHGAGKSTIALVLSGFVKQNKGCIRINNRDVENFSIKTAKKMGIEIVSQNNHLFDNMTIADNLFCNNKSIFKRLFFSKKRLLQEAETYLRSFDLNFNPSTIIRNLDLPSRVIIDIVRHIYIKPRLLILDEALEKISAVDLQKILPFLKSLKDAGLSIMFITHRIDDIYDFADTITILRKGRVIITDSVHNIDKINLIKLA